nr:hypothetical protein [Chloroflexota bacterium]
MDSTSIPSLDDFLSDSSEHIRKYAPETFIYAASGTRRAAVLAGVPDEGDELAIWSRGELFRNIELIFVHGVRHLFMPMLGPSQFRESTGNYHEYLWNWFVEGISGPKAIDRYQSSGWRVRIACGDFIPQVKEMSEKLISETTKNDAHTLWCYAVPDFSLPWEWLLEAAKRGNASTYQEAVNALYGENIPPASIYLSTVKPLVSSLQLPPLLVRE